MYSVPGDLIGQRVDVRADGALVKIYHRGRLVKAHPRRPAGGRCTDAADLPAERAGCALRDVDGLRARAAGHGAAVGEYDVGCRSSGCGVFPLMRHGLLWGLQSSLRRCGRHGATRFPSARPVGPIKTDGHASERGAMTPHDPRPTARIGLVMLAGRALAGRSRPAARRTPGRSDPDRS